MVLSSVNTLLKGRPIMRISGIDITPLLPASIWPVVRSRPNMRPDKSGILPPAQNLLNDRLRIQMSWVQLQMSGIGEGAADNDYRMYLEFPNSRVEAVAMSIVNRTDTNDVKAYKIMMWVQENIEYKTDTENYGQPERWARPTETLAIMSGDCEDGAFLTHSLMLSAGIPWDRVRTYGGLVEAGTNAPLGGHGWTVYKRETDNQWVPVDWCYYPEDTPLAERTRIQDDLRYWDDFWLVDAMKTVETPLYNSVRNPPAIGSNRYFTGIQWVYQKGQRVNLTA